MYLPLCKVADTPFYIRGGEGWVVNPWSKPTDFIYSVILCGFYSRFRKFLDPMLGYCWASVADDGPTLNQHWENILNLWNRCYVLTEILEKGIIFSQLKLWIASARRNKWQNQIIIKAETSGGNFDFNWSCTEWFWNRKLRTGVFWSCDF